MCCKIVILEADATDYGEILRPLPGEFECCSLLRPLPIAWPVWMEKVTNGFGRRRAGKSVEGREKASEQVGMRECLHTISPVHAFLSLEHHLWPWFKCWMKRWGSEYFLRCPSVSSVLLAAAALVGVVRMSSLRLWASGLLAVPWCPYVPAQPMLVPCLTVTVQVVWIRPGPPEDLRPSWRPTLFPEGGLCSFWGIGVGGPFWPVIEVTIINVSPWLSRQEVSLFIQLGSLPLHV